MKYTFLSGLSGGLFLGLVSALVLFGVVTEFLNPDGPTECITIHRADYATRPILF